MSEPTLGNRVPFSADTGEVDEWIYTSAGRMACESCGEWIYTRRRADGGGAHAFPPQCQVCGAAIPAHNSGVRDHE